MDTSAEIAALFDAHGGKEEAGLFAELRAEGHALDVVRGRRRITAASRWAWGRIRKVPQDRSS